MTILLVVVRVSQATRELAWESSATPSFTSLVRKASSTVSEIWSHTLSGCPSETHSLVNRQLLPLATVARPPRASSWEMLGGASAPDHSRAVPEGQAAHAPASTSCPRRNATRPGGAGARCWCGTNLGSGSVGLFAAAQRLGEVEYFLPHPPAVDPVIGAHELGRLALGERVRLVIRRGFGEAAVAATGGGRDLGRHLVEKELDRDVQNLGELVEPA